MSALEKTKKGLLHTWSQKVTKYVGRGSGNAQRSGAFTELPRGKTTRDRSGSGGHSVAEPRLREAGADRGSMREHATSVEAIKGGSVPQGQLPLWLRKRSAPVRHERRRVAEREAASGKPIGLALDGQTKAILAGLPKLDPTPKVADDYRQTHANLVRLEHTPQDHANSKAHYGKLRTAWRFGEVEAVQALRKESEKARRAGNMEQAEALTVRAFERACALDWQCSTESWTNKATELKAKGLKPVRKSKRFGKKAPTATATVVNATCSTNAVSEKLWARHELRVLTVATFGIRPSELKHEAGVQLVVTAKNGRTFITAGVHGAKVDSQRGHFRRNMTIEIKGSALETAGLKHLAELVGDGVTVHTSEADQRSANRMLNGMQKGLSLYSYRHAIGGNLKAGIASGDVSAVKAAEFMGHRSTASLCAYGYRKGSKAGKYGARVDGLTPTVEKVPRLFNQPSPREEIHFPPRPPQAPHRQRATASPLAGMKPKPPR